MSRAQAKTRCQPTFRHSGGMWAFRKRVRVAGVVPTPIGDASLSVPESCPLRVGSPSRTAHEWGTTPRISRIHVWDVPHPEVLKPGLRRPRLRRWVAGVGLLRFTASQPQPYAACVTHERTPFSPKRTPAIRRETVDELPWTDQLGILKQRDGRDRRSAGRRSKLRRGQSVGRRFHHDDKARSDPPDLPLEHPGLPRAHPGRRRRLGLVPSWHPSAEGGGRRDRASRRGRLLRLGAGQADRAQVGAVGPEPQTPASMADRTLRPRRGRVGDRGLPAAGRYQAAPAPGRPTRPSAIPHAARRHALRSGRGPASRSPRTPLLVDLGEGARLYPFPARRALSPRNAGHQRGPFHRRRPRAPGRLSPPEDPGTARRRNHQRRPCLPGRPDRLGDLAPRRQPNPRRRPPSAAWPACEPWTSRAPPSATRALRPWPT